MEPSGRMRRRRASHGDIQARARRWRLLGSKRSWARKAVGPKGCGPKRLWARRASDARTGYGPKGYDPKALGLHGGQLAAPCGTGGTCGSPDPPALWARRLWARRLFTPSQEVPAVSASPMNFPARAIVRCHRKFTKYGALDSNADPPTMCLSITIVPLTALPAPVPKHPASLAENYAGPPTAAHDLSV